MRHTSFNVLVGSLLLATVPAIAQTTAPSSGAPATTGGGMGWLWFVILLAIAGAAIWYFAFGRTKPVVTRFMSAGSGTTASGTSSMGIDSDRVAGSAQQAKGSIKEGVGSVLGEPSSRPRYDQRPLSQLGSPVTSLAWRVRGEHFPAWYCP